MTATTPSCVSFESATLLNASYDHALARLQLEFRDGTRYTYFGVLPELFQDLLRATSKGAFFNRYIRTHFPHARLPG
jgi:KTSC domain